ncbi:hypothetical protein GO730_24865 [Spirosoma sp. HMF3257]|uniref:Apea-like HEPN domain-containing protein n=1 Tax=Spirosoma telluris TaxID=2183553 RepID=A0A327NRJ3_9BACT|nr:hypothetical protein [Spirosoma telluris]RAI76576.1 hypothetical protein HMF3257_24805 [Spirosoma telluris]
MVYAGLSPWLGITGITKELLNDGQSFTGISMEYKQPESLKFDIGSLFKLQIDFGYSPGSDPRTFTGYELKETCYTSFIFKEPGINFKDLLKWIEHYRRLLTTLFGQSSFITYFRVTDSLDLTLNNSYNVFYRNTIDGFPNRAPSLTRMRTQFKDISIPLTNILNRWSMYHLSDDLDYVGWVASKNFHHFSEETFLEVSRSLEVFCGAIMSKNVYSEEIKEKFKLSIINKIYIGEIFGNKTNKELSDSDKDSFDDIVEKMLSAITYSDSISLRRKIKNALSLIKEQLDNEKFKELFSDAKSLPDVIVDNRNYYTHYDENSIKKIKKNELNIEQLVLLTRKVKKIFLLLLFKDLGIPMQQIANSLIHLDVS